MTSETGTNLLVPNPADTRLGQRLPMNMFAS